MKKILALLVTTACSHYCFSQFPSLPIGSAIPFEKHTLKDVSGKEISVRSAMGRNGVLVMFSCNTCPYVKRNQTRTKQLAAAAKNHNIGVVLLNSNEGGRNEGDSYTDMKAYAAQQRYDFYYALDTGSRLADAYGASRTPEVYLFDAAGRLQYKGAIDDNPSDEGRVTRRHALEAINEITSGKTVTVKESRSVGCGIKRQ